MVSSRLFRGFADTGPARRLRPVLAAIWLTGLAACQASAPDAPVADAIDRAKSPPAAGAQPPASVLGLQPRDVRQLLGAPKLVRRDAPAEVWQYRSDACVLDLFIYNADAEPRVRYVEARTIAAEPAIAEACVDAIRRQRSGDRLPAT